MSRARPSGSSPVAFLLVLAVAGLLAMSALVAPPAGAATDRVSDPRSDGRYGEFGELHGMTTTYGKRRLTVTTTFRTLADYHEFRVKAPGRRTPSFVVTWYTEDGLADSLRTVYVSTWRQYRDGGYDDVCALRTARYRPRGSDPDTLTFWVPRRCLRVGGDALRAVQVNQSTFQLAAEFDGASDRVRYSRILRAPR